MKLKHALSTGGIIGLLVGAIMCVLGFCLASAGDGFETVFGLIHWPLNPLFTRIFSASASYGWSYKMEVGLLSAIILIYWFLIGVLIGLAWQLFFCKRGHNAV